MKIERLYIDGFGHFADKILGPFDSPITIFSGQNEAGKSTILAFIRTIFFGFPTIKRSEYYSPLNGGRHGGNIIITDDDGSVYTVERYTGVRGGPISIRDDTGTVYPESKLGQLVGNCTKGVFEKVFAFGLDELQEMRSLDEEEVQGRIYSAGIGVKDLTQVTNELESSRNKIFLPTGHFGANQTVSPLLSELDTVEGQVSSHLQDAPRFAELTLRLEQIAVEISELGQTGEAYNRTLDHQRNLLSAREDLIEIGILESKLSNLTPPLQFPQDGIPRLGNISEQISQLKVDVDEQLVAIRNLEEIVDQPLAGSQVLEDADGIRTCRFERQRLYSALEDLPDRIGKVTQQTTEVERLLTELGPAWDIPKVETLDISSPIRDRVDQEKNQNIILNQSVSNRENSLESAEREFQTANVSVERAEKLLNEAGNTNFDGAMLAARRTAISTSRDGLGRRSELLRQVDEIRNQNSNKPGAATRLFVLLSGVILCAAGIGVTTWSVIGYSDLLTLAVGLFMLVLGVGLSIIGLRMTSVQGRSAQLEEIQSQISDLELLLVQARTILALDNIDFSNLQAANTALESETLLWNDQQRLTQNHQSAIEELGKRNQDLTLAVDGLEKARANMAKAQSEWKLWLANKLSTESLSPDGVLELLETIRQTRTSIGQQHEEQNRVAAIRRIIDGVGTQIIKLAERHTVVVNSEQPTSLIPAIDELSRLFEVAQEESQAKDSQQLSLSEKLDKLSQNKRRLESLEEDLRTLLMQVNTEDPEEFRRLAAVNEEYQGYSTRLETSKTTVAHVFGPDADLVGLLNEIGEQSSENLEGKISETRQLLKDLQDERDDLNSELTLSQQELDDLSKSDEASDLLVKRETLLEGLREQGLEWSKYCLALSVLQMARTKHERERQPKVVQTASEFFKEVTSGAYSGLRAPVGQSSIIAVAKSGEEKTATQLSRGTREQMYLALRFGLVKEFNQHIASLPVVVDDVLVNSDPVRAEALVNQFISLSETNQIFVFTCHPNLVKQFTDAYPRAQVHHL